MFNEIHRDLLMICDRNAKCDYGSDESFHDTETFSVRVPKLDRTYSNPQHSVSGGDMHFKRHDTASNSIPDGANISLEMI